MHSNNSNILHGYECYSFTSANLYSTTRGSSMFRYKCDLYHTARTIKLCMDIARCIGYRLYNNLRRNRGDKQYRDSEMVNIREQDSNHPVSYTHLRAHET